MNVLGSTEIYVTSRHSEHPRGLESTTTPLLETRFSCISLRAEYAAL